MSTESGPPSSELVHPSLAEGLPVSPALELVAEVSQTPTEPALVDGRVVFISLLGILLGLAAGGVAVVFMRLIAFVTNLAFFQQISFETVSPADNHLGWIVIVVPVVGGLIVGVMARYGSKAIRGHGIPEAMEQVLSNESRIPARLTLLKPLSAAVAIGTGGPFGAEGPIIATGGALGSMLGQILSTTAQERKTLLAAGAAAGMAATFNSPVSSVLLAIELLLFEYRARSVIPVALASATAAGVHILIEGPGAVFVMPHVAAPTLSALAFYAVLGCVMGVLAVLATRLIYWIEDGFEESLPVHWMWWPAIGAVAVGIVGYFEPRTLGVGYKNISDCLSANFIASAALMLGLLKLVSWSISLSSGTSGGTLAPLCTIGAALGLASGGAINAVWPGLGVEVQVAALVGMAAMFGGASRAFLASAVFAFETTLEPFGLLPLLAGCTTSHLVSCLLMRNTIMTEKIARRGLRPPSEYLADVLDQVLTREFASRNVIALQAGECVEKVRAWFAEGSADSRHQGFPVLDANRVLVGVLTHTDIAQASSPATLLRDMIQRPPKFVYEDTSVRQAAEHMANHDIGRLPVMSHSNPPQLVGILTRSDVLDAFRRTADEHRRAAPTISFGAASRAWRNGRKSSVS
ncbi:MAG TPA: chloride channel protein [Lacipirellulaceae bacterium]|jgi:H+/Cl- antiporter ClcA|nr:chloride channel protein [Lacipirellulaceae bacterium]